MVSSCSTKTKIYHLAELGKKKNNHATGGNLFDEHAFVKLEYFLTALIPKLNFAEYNALQIFVHCYDQ